MNSSFLSIGKTLLGNGHRRNVMSQLNWVVGFLESLLATICYLSTELWMQIGFFIVFVIILILYFGIYIYFCISDPSRLQSEEYNLEYHALNVMYQDGSDSKNQLKVSTNNKTIVQKS
jgi:hypothetical protein